MAGTKIEWAQKVWNPITGCSPISEGCQNCYARRMAYRLKKRYGYPEDDPFRVTFHTDRLKEPTVWRKPRRIFVCSMADLFHENVGDEWIAAVMLVASICSHHTFMILTKRPDRMKAWFDRHPFGYTQGEALAEFGHLIDLRSPQGRRDRINGEGTINGNGDNKWPLPNIWLGVTAENQARADERIPILLQIPAKMRFVSVEPMLGPVDLTKIDRPITGPGSYQPAAPPSFRRINAINGFNCILDHKCRGAGYIGPKLDWVICGGETGPGARPMHPDWVQSLRDQCQGAGVPFFFKQWGEWLPAGQEQMGALINGMDNKTRSRIIYGGEDHMFKVGRKHAGRLLDGRTWNEFPGGAA